MTKLSVLAVQMTKELAEKMHQLAESNDRTMQQEIRAALRGHVDREAEKEAS